MKEAVISLDRPGLPRAGVETALGNILRGHSWRCFRWLFSKVRKGLKSKVAMLETV